MGGAYAASAGAGRLLLKEGVSAGLPDRGYPTPKLRRWTV